VSALDPVTTGQLAATLPREDFRRILRTFAADLGRLADDFAEAVATADEEAQRRAAHSLAGTAAGIGALRLEAAARLAMSQQHGVVPDTLAHRIRDEAAAALAALSELAEVAPG
jgi:HPt (histidine-containing phosphotransfer) domain-containing protein